MGGSQRYLHEALKGFDFSPSLDILVAAGALPLRGKMGSTEGSLRLGSIVATVRR
jgi:hypothetical protein